MGHSEFKKKIPLEPRIALEASESAYAVSGVIKNLEHNEIIMAYPIELSCITKSNVNAHSNLPIFGH